MLLIQFVALKLLQLSPGFLKKRYLSPPGSSPELQWNLGTWLASMLSCELWLVLGMFFTYASTTIVPKINKCPNTMGGKSIVTAMFALSSWDYHTTKITVTFVISHFDIV